MMTTFIMMDAMMSTSQMLITMTTVKSAIIMAATGITINMTLMTAHLIKPKKSPINHHSQSTNQLEVWGVGGRGGFEDTY